MPVFFGCSACLPNGEIAAGYDFNGAHAPEELAGTVTWDWFHGDDRDVAITMFARAVVGEPMPPAMLAIDGVRERMKLVCVTRYIPTGVPALPVLGVFAAYDARVLGLTEQERDVAKLWTDLTVSQIAKKLRVSSRTVQNIRHRIAEHLGVDGARLEAMLLVLKDVL